MKKIYFLLCAVVPAILSTLPANSQMIPLSGTEKTENIPSAKSTMPDILYYVKVFPNPAQSSVNVSFTLSAASSITVYITRWDGKLLAVWNGGRYEAGFYTISMLLPSSIQSGTYFLEVVSDRNTQRFNLRISR